MTTLELRRRLHELIDGLEGDQLLEQIYELLSGVQQGQGVWADLSEAERQRVLRSYRSALTGKGLSTTEEVMRRRRA